MRKQRFAAALVVSTLLAGCSETDPAGPVPTKTMEVRNSVSAAEFNGRIRIGVVPSTSSLTLGSAGDFTVTESGTGKVLMTGSNGTVTVTVTSGGSYYRLQVMCGSAQNVAVRTAAAEALGHPTYSVYYAAAGCYRLYIGQFPNNASFSTRNAYKNLLISQGLANSSAFWVVITTSQAAYSIKQGAQTVTTTVAPVLTSTTGLVTIDGTTYRDAAEARMNAAGLLAGVNELPIEQYLYGVVPMELGPIAYPEIEAQKAQAVAARTYAMAGLGKRAADGYDLLATTADQVYGGYSVEHPVSNAAVDATRGVVLTHDGNLISALYSSASGGHTADSEEAFAGVVSYLRGVPDQERGQALEHVPSLEVFRSHANGTSLRALRAADFESDWSRFHRWHYEWNEQEIHDVVSAFAGTDVGRVLSITVTERGPSGRAIAIEYETEAGTFTDTKDHIRSSLRFYNASHVLTNLPSTMFYVEPVYGHGPLGGITGFEVFGGGFGHGVGMAQTGAVGMAQRGHAYDEILHHYYRDVELTTMY